jgi:hypothetical protein
VVVLNYWPGEKNPNTTGQAEHDRAGWPGEKNPNTTGQFGLLTRGEKSELADQRIKIRTGWPGEKNPNWLTRGEKSERFGARTRVVRMEASRSSWRRSAGAAMGEGVKSEGESDDGGKEQVRRLQALLDQERSARKRAEARDLHTQAENAQKQQNVLAHRQRLQDARCYGHSLEMAIREKDKQLKRQQRTATVVATLCAVLGVVIALIVFACLQ